MGVTLDKDGLVTWPRARDEVGCLLIVSPVLQLLFDIAFGLGMSFHALHIAHPCWKKRRNEA